jgi:anti-sigma-K factor RskA
LNLRNKPELVERLAAEYALGTLRGRARDWLRRAMREDAALARAVTEWEARLAPAADAVRAVEPPARVWRGIEERLGPPVPPKKGSFWRSLGLVAAGAAAALVAVAVLLPPEKPGIPAAYVAVLSDPKTQRAVMVVSARRNETALQIKMLDPSIRVADRSLELWALPLKGGPRSLGLLESEKTALKLVSAADQALGDVPTLAVSLEPRGGSRTGAPTGPVLYSGPCVKYW